MARHKEFDPDVALDRAMGLFWEQGYEKTSMQDLVERMGVHKRSMYDTFGDKHSLYLKALNRYAETVQRGLREDAEAEESPREALRRLFRSSIAGIGETPKGCLAVNCATEMASRDPEVAGWVERNFDEWYRVLVDLVRRGQRAGEVSPQADPGLLAGSLFNAWVGLRVQVRAGASRERLEEMVDGMLVMLHAPERPAG
ncbi:TetR/AcrR family transcriptional regulator [Micromonospora sp. CPCC 205539]|uniref:TetR/AcrR family transcriptional regulator n=1 Tax=Micromonospora sp. CPCC 205539 TaxID=3122408 RepID=UPI002FEFE1D3